MSFKVIGIGEVLWDLLPSGPQLGGAPANFAYHAQALGARAGVVTRVGSDHLGGDIQRRLDAFQLPLDLVQVDESAPTGTVSVELGSDGNPCFTIHERVAWDRLIPTEAALRAVGTADAICFGSLAQRDELSRSTIQKLLNQSAQTSLRVFDVNLRQSFYSRKVIEQSLELANTLKLNDAELPVLANLFGWDGDMETQVRMIADRFGLTVAAITCGAQGSFLYQRGRWSECQVRPVRVKDTVGAGDAFTAALVIGLLRKMDLDEINVAANEVARHVCSCEGGTPPLPESLRGIFTHPSRNAPSGTSERAVEQTRTVASI